MSQPARPRHDCGRKMRYLNGEWQCVFCVHQPSRQETARQAARKANEKKQNAVKAACTKGYTNRAESKHQRTALIPKSVRSPWLPSWADQSTEPIITAVRDAKAAARRLRGS